MKKQLINVTSIEEAIGVIADQRKYKDDIRIVLPDGTQIKGTVVETHSHSDHKLVAHVTADTFPERSFDLTMRLLINDGDAFLTHVGVGTPSNVVVTRRWTRLKPL